MAEYGFTMKRYNAQSKDFDIMYPRTKIEQVEGDLQHQITTMPLTLGTAWSVGEGYYYQPVTITSGDANTKVDLQADYETFGTMMQGGISSVFVSNDNGVFTAYAIGETPTEKMTFQATLTNANAT